MAHVEFKSYCDIPRNALILSELLPMLFLGPMLGEYTDEAFLFRFGAQ